MTIERKTHKLDATDKSLGRVASEAAKLLIGKNKTSFEPNKDVGDFVQILNVDKIKLTGNKAEQKKYYSHSQYPGGLKEVPISKYIEEGNYQKIMLKTIDKMLPKNKHRVIRLKRIIFGTNK